MKIGEILVEAGKITPAQLASALEQQSRSSSRKTLGQVLVEEGVVTGSDVMQALGRQYHLAVLERIHDELIDLDLIERIPVDWTREHQVFPLRRDGEVLGVMADPASMPRLEELSILIGEEMSGALSTPAEIKRVIDQAYFERKKENALPDRQAESKPDSNPAAVRADDLLREYDAAPVTQLVNSIILDAVRRKASDIHIEPFENHLRIRFRIDGFLYEQSAPPKHLEQSLISRIKVMSRLDIAERRLPQDGMAKVRAGEREIDIRVSTVPVAEGERVVLRLLNQSSTVLPLTELGMSDSLLSGFRTAMTAPNGVMLVTGPTGSGKTTTLYAALRELDTQHRNIMTIEDPIEYQMANIGQMQVKPKIGLTFASGLRHILRQDPDVILVGEIRDQETAEIAIRAALTGHLVLSTLHTNDAASATVRLADMGIQSYLIASSIRAVMAQRLVRRLCPSCRVETEASPQRLAGAGDEFRTLLAGRKIYKPAGCADCMQGYRGRVGIYELIAFGVNEQEMIRRGDTVSRLRAASADQGLSMARDAAAKILSGTTSLDEALRVMEIHG